MSASKTRKRAALLQRREAQAERAIASMMEAIGRVGRSGDPNGDIFISTVRTSDTEEDCDCPLCAAMEGGLGEPVESCGLGSALHRMSPEDMMIYRQICDDMAAGKYGEKYRNVERLRVQEL